MDNELFRRRLAERRKEKGYKSQKSFADAYNKRFNTGVQIEDGSCAGILGTLKNYEAAGKKCNPRLEIVSNMCVLLDCSVDYLLGNIDECTHEATNVKNLAKATGLSEQAVELLTKWKSDNPNEIRMLTKLICTIGDAEQSCITTNLAADAHKTIFPMNAEELIMRLMMYLRAIYHETNLNTNDKGK